MDYWTDFAHQVGEGKLIEFLKENVTQLKWPSLRIPFRDVKSDASGIRFQIPNINPTTVLSLHEQDWNRCDLWDDLYSQHVTPTYTIWAYAHSSDESFGNYLINVYGLPALLWITDYKGIVGLAVVITIVLALSFCRRRREKPKQI